MSFDLATVQATVKSLIEQAALTNAVLNGVTVIDEKTTESLDKATEPELRTDGICMVVTLPYLEGVFESGNGYAILAVGVYVFIVENPKVNNNGTTGLGKNPLEVTQNLWGALLGKPEGRGHKISMSDQGFVIAELGSLLVYDTAFEMPLFVKGT